MPYAERLEKRRLFATVFEGFPGYFEVWGTTGDDVISISVDQANSTFSLDGVTYRGVLQVSVYGLDGNDNVSVGGRGINVSAVIWGGLGDDTLALGLDGAAWGEEGRDTITLRDSNRGEAYGGPGNDTITLRGDTIDARVNGEEDNDVLVAMDNNYGVILFGGVGDDRLYGSKFNDVMFDGPGRDFVFGLGGHDEFDSRDGEPDWVMGGDGNDILWADPAEGGIHGMEHVFYG